MRIISKFHDYYDGVQAYGQDASTVFVRQTEEADPKDELLKSDKNVHFNVEYRYADGRRFARVNAFAIAFCGKVYRGVHVAVMNGYNIRNLFFYSFESFIEYNTEKTLNLSSYMIKEVAKYFSQDNSRIESSLVNRKIITAYRGRDGYEMKLFINPNLSKYDFFTVKNTYEAYQEIEQYISGVIGNIERDTVGISDKYLAMQKGFDCYSFKKEPSKRNKKECK